MHGQVRVDQPDQGLQLGKSNPLADHLRADEDIDLLPPEIPRISRKRFFFVIVSVSIPNCPAAPGGAPVAPPLRPAGCSRLPPPDVRRLALRAAGGSRPLVAAEMTAQRLVGPVIRERDAAMRAFFYMPAFRAEHRRRISPPIDEQDRLLPALDPRLHRLDQAARKARESPLAGNLDSHASTMSIWGSWRQSTR